LAVRVRRDGRQYTSVVENRVPEVIVSRLVARDNTRPSRIIRLLIRASVELLGTLQSLELLIVWIDDAASAWLILSDSCFQIPLRKDPDEGCACQPRMRVG
jgi:hypothetical protein